MQIVALGCGLETLWFNLMDEGYAIKDFRFVELDLELVVKRKIRKIKKSKKLGSLFDRLKVTPKISGNGITIQSISTCSTWAASTRWPPVTSPT